MAARCLLIILAASVVLNSHSPAAASWKPVSSADGIQVYTQPVEGSDMDAFRGVAVVDAPIESVAAVINDIPAQPRWMASCTEARVIKELGENAVLIYRVTKAPWPVSDRDMVIVSTAVIEPGGRRIVANFAATDNHGVPPRNGVVRIRKMRGQWILEKLSPDRTRVSLTVHSDPGGSLPPSVANRASRDIPLKTLRGLRRIVREPKYNTR
ncbi:MAG TPA: hypothetical protein ENN21_01345 [Spirochaetes bacterium]|nr:hypothetical protein [Spirochaetota bacterium]